MAKRAIRDAIRGYHVRVVRSRTMRNRSSEMDPSTSSRLKNATETLGMQRLSEKRKKARSLTRIRVGDPTRSNAARDPAGGSLFGWSLSRKGQAVSVPISCVSAYARVINIGTGKIFRNFRKKSQKFFQNCLTDFLRNAIISKLSREEACFFARSGLLLQAIRRLTTA